MKRIIILTGSELRHTFVRQAIAMESEIDVVRSYCEGSEKGLLSVVQPRDARADLQIQHISARACSEEDFFSAFVRMSPDNSNPTQIQKGSINDPLVRQEILDFQPDLLVAFGCSIVREPLISAFPERFLNVHLGISPYYRGSGTNFWALVNGEPEYVGATFMYIAPEVDKGRVIHQLRARVFPGDSPHQIGNRLICDVVESYTRIIKKFEELPDVEQIQVTSDKYYRQRDFTPESVLKLYENFNKGLVDRYLTKCRSGIKLVPIMENPVL